MISPRFAMPHFKKHLARLAHLSLWMLAPLVVLLAYDPFTPYLLRIRPWVLTLAWGAAAVGIGGTVWLLLRWRKAQQALNTMPHLADDAVALGTQAHWLQTIPRAMGRGLSWVEIGLLFALFTGSAIATAWQAWFFSEARQQVLNHSSSSPALTTLGRHFIISYKDFDEAATLAARGAIAGIYLRSANVQDKTPFQVRTEIMALQRLRERNGLPALIIAADQEGGAVQHMSPPLPHKPALAQLLAHYPTTLEDEAGSDSPSPKASADTLLAVYAYALEQGQELHNLGVNLNFGPVADLSPSPDAARAFDSHTKLHLRALSAHPFVVAEALQAYISGLQHGGVQATLKHFPGLSRVAADTHHFAAALNTPQAVLQRSDWVPFRAAMPQAAATMLGHITLDDIDPSAPASLSPKVIAMLRNEWHYQGLLMTDDINMGALYHRYGICESTVRALNAGVDLVLIAYDSDQFYPAMACALQAMNRGELRLPHSPQTHQRIARWFPDRTPHQAAELQLASQHPTPVP